MLVLQELQTRLRQVYNHSVGRIYMKEVLEISPEARALAEKWGKAISAARAEFDGARGVTDEDVSKKAAKNRAWKNALSVTERIWRRDGENGLSPGPDIIPSLRREAGLTSSTTNASGSKQ